MNMFLYLISCLALIYANYKIYIHTREETHRITCLQRQAFSSRIARNDTSKLLERNGKPLTP
jgi:hypothetical protein